MNKIIFGDNLEALKTIETGSVNVSYSDIPYGTGKVQKRGNIEYNDPSENYKEFIYPRIEEVYRVLAKDGSFFLHADYRWIHYLKVWCDEIFGRENFINEIIWSYDYGGRSKVKWPAKHDNILFYAKNHKKYTFRYDQIDRIPYLAPGLVGPEKASKGKTLTDVWQNTIVPTMSKENLHYPTQKPLAILNRIIKVHSYENDLILDWCAGSGSLGEAAGNFNRSFIMIDNNPSAIEIMEKRLAKFNPEIIKI